MYIIGFEWDEPNKEDGNLQHLLSRHNVSDEEAEEVFVIAPCFKRPKKAKGKIRHYVLGVTSAGRYLLVVYEFVKEGIVRVISARDLDKNERNNYLRR